MVFKRRERERSLRNLKTVRMNGAQRSGMMSSIRASMGKYYKQETGVRVYLRIVGFYSLV